VLDGIRTKITDEIVQQLLTAAMKAPSAANEQSWEFVVIRDRKMLDEIPAFGPLANMVKRAPLGILVCADTRNVVFLGFWVQDCSAATQNLLIAAHALGL
jgi:nitroreductase